MTTSADAEKASDKIQCPFMIKTLSKPEFGDSLFNLRISISSKVTGRTINIFYVVLLYTTEKTPKTVI